jgi:hypothetical protein
MIMIKKVMILITKKTIITIKMEKTTIMSGTKKVHMTMINNNYRVTKKLHD